MTDVFLPYPYWADNTGGDSDDRGGWDRVQLGSIWLPGLATVTVTTGRAVDSKKTKGKDGATLTDNGSEPAKVQIDLWIGKRADWSIWCAVYPQINPRRAGAIRNPLQLSHPGANFAGVQNVYVKGITLQPPTSKGGMRIKIDCEEWFAQPKKTTATKKVQHLTYSNADPLAAARAANPYAFMPTGADAIDAAFKKF